MIWFVFLLAALGAYARHIPSITLPWGTWEATRYDETGDFWTFENIRFGKPPVGNLRFSVSSIPDDISDPQTIQNSSYGPSCLQIDSSEPCTPGFSIADVPDSCYPEPRGHQSEDCLFLDLYVPNIAFSHNSTNATKLPVVVWFHGGAFILGGKNVFHDPQVPLYNFTGLGRTANRINSPTVFVTGNYRLGALGWLAGSYMELLAQVGVASPNAGFHDQQLLLQWVQKYIHLVGGDPRNVSAWGESAGAGSIFHHLLAEQGTRDPLFNRAILQSPGFTWQWDRTGTLNELYRNFSKIAGCDDTFDICCLRRLSSSQIKEANQNLFTSGTKCSGLFALGPALDGKTFHDLPPVAFRKGHYWKHISSLVISHVGNETGNFVADYIRNDNTSDFDYFVDSMIPEKKLKPLRKAIKKKYPAKKYPDQRVRTQTLIRDGCFTCNTRQLFEAYSNITFPNVYMMQYNMLGYWDLAVHASDLLPLFWNSDVNLTFWLRSCGKYSAWESAMIQYAAADLSSSFQERFVRHAATGNPNAPKDKWWSIWSQAYERPWLNPKGALRNVMEVGGNDVLSGFGFSSWTMDEVNTRENCDFWNEAAENITAISQREELENGLVVKQGYHGTGRI